MSFASPIPSPAASPTTTPTTPPDPPKPILEDKAFIQRVENMGIVLAIWLVTGVIAFALAFTPWDLWGSIKWLCVIVAAIFTWGAYDVAFSRKNLLELVAVVAIVAAISLIITGLTVFALQLPRVIWELWIIGATLVIMIGLTRIEWEVETGSAPDIKKEKRKIPTWLNGPLMTLLTYLIMQFLLRISM